MTIQASELLVYKGEMLLMKSFPLDVYFAQIGEHPAFAFDTGVTRGYIGHWAIEDYRLYLHRIDAEMMDDSEFNLARCFPDTPDPMKVFAEWFSGPLYCSRGSLLKSLRMGYLRIYEEDIFFDVHQGLVIGIKRHNNRERSECGPTKCKLHQLFAKTDPGD